MTERITSEKLTALIGKTGGRSKYNVDNSAAGKLARQYRGVTYDSLAEARYAAQLDIRLKAGQILEWERQVTVPLIVNGSLVGRMIADFKITHLNQRQEFIEVKGMVLPIYKLKLKLFRELYPDTLYTVVNSKEI